MIQFFTVSINLELDELAKYMIIIEQKFIREEKQGNIKVNITAFLIIFSLIFLSISNGTVRTVSIASIANALTGLVTMFIFFYF